MKSRLTKHKKDRKPAAQGCQSLRMHSPEHCYQLAQLSSLSVYLCLRFKKSWGEKSWLDCSGSFYLPLGSKNSDSSQKNGMHTVYPYVYICMYVVYKYTHECMADACLCICVHVCSYICIWYLCMSVCVGLWMWVCIVFLYVQVHMCSGRTGWENTVHRIRYFLIKSLRCSWISVTYPTSCVTSYITYMSIF